MALLASMFFGVLLFTAYSVNSMTNDNFNMNARAIFRTCAESPLHTAVRAGDVRAVDRLVKEGADIYALNCESLTSMHVAVLSDSDEMVLALARNRFDVNRKFNKGNTVLFHAAVHGMEKPLRKLVYLGAIVDFVNSEGSTPLYEAVAAYRPDMVRVLVSLGADTKKILPGGNTYLHKAAEEDNFDAALFLAGLGIPVDTLNNGGETPLNKSIIRDNPALVNFLISSGADITKTSKQGETYLHTAVRSRSVESLRALLEHSLPPDSKDSNQYTPIYGAVEKDDTRAAEVLLEFGANLNQKWRDDEINLLHWAATCGSTASIRWLILKGLSVNSLNICNYYALLYAAKFNQVEAAKILVELHSCINCRACNGYTPLGRALSMNSQAVAEYLRSVGAKE